MPRAVPVPVSNTSERWKLAIPAALFVALLLWVFWPAHEKVKNLASKGTAVVAFGDSLTAGYGAAAGEDYPTELAKRLAMPVINAGVSGETTEAAAARIPAVLAENPRLVIVGLGGNDFLRGTEIARTEGNLRNIVREIQKGGAMVVLLGFRFPSLAANYDAMYERVAEEEGCLLIPDLLDGILSDPALRSDPVHPNGAGYAVMAERIAGPTKKLLRAR